MLGSDRIIDSVVLFAPVTGYAVPVAEFCGTVVLRLTLCSQKDVILNVFCKTIISKLDDQELMNLLIDYNSISMHQRNKKM